jgi:Protein of unknown function (DUF2510)
MKSKIAVEPTQTPVGWYPAVTPGLLRYWDGAQWTADMEPVEPPASLTASGPFFPPGFILLAIILAVVLWVAL